MLSSLLSPSALSQSSNLFVLLLRLSTASSEICLSKYHIALENFCVIFKYLLIVISSIIPSDNITDCMIYSIFRP